MNMPRRFFSDDSFWNQPIPDNPEIDERSKRWTDMLSTEPTGENFYMNSTRWTIPVYEVDSSCPDVEIAEYYLSQREQERSWKTKREKFGHGPGFGKVPLPEDAIPDGEEDAHLAVVDWGRNLVWDMWKLSRGKDGKWKSATGMVYPADGPGDFISFGISPENGESVHFHGPSRAAGLPAIAGLIMYDEVMAGEIRHRLSVASRFCALQEFVYPATWTDGRVVGGIPEGSVIQMDPALDLSQFELTPEEIVVCNAFKKYGAVFVDCALGQPLYAERLSGQAARSWEGKLPDGGGISKIPYRHYRFIKSGPAIYKGDCRNSMTPEKAASISNWHEA